MNQRKRLCLLRLYGRKPIQGGRWSIYRVIINTLFLLVFMESAVLGSSGPATGMDKLRALTVTQSCDRLHSEVLHMMQVNELINKDDPQSYLSMQRTLNLYLGMIDQQCQSNQKRQMEIVTK